MDALFPRHEPPARRDHGLSIAVRIAAAVAALALVVYVVTGQTRAAFNATTSNSGNSFSAGSVTISDNDSGTAMFSASGLKPTDSVTSCIKVTYGTGSLTPAAVKMYGTVTSSGTNLAPYLNTTIDVGTGPTTFGNCTGFTSSSTIYSGTLSNFASTYTNWSNGLSVWNPSSTPDSKWLRFTVTLADNNSAQGADATAAFTWEAQNT
jgi:hypothetical protein